MKRRSQKVGVLLLQAFLLTGGLWTTTSIAQTYGNAVPASEKDPVASKKNSVEKSGEATDSSYWLADADDTLRNELKAAPPPLSPRADRPAIDLSKIDDNVLKEFKKAWRISKAGTLSIEGVVLLFQGIDGSYIGRSQGSTNEYKAFTFTWQPNAIAIVHTHPNTSDPRPHDEDRRIADRLKVPIFTITTRGMYMYDPGTKKITKVLEGVDWLDFPRAYQRASQR